MTVRQVTSWYVEIVKYPEKRFSLKVELELNLTSGFRIDDKTQYFYFSVFYPFSQRKMLKDIYFE